MSKPQYVPGTFCWFECATHDVAKAKQFYTQLFGWKAVDQPMPGDMPGHYTLLRIGDDDVAGMYPMQGERFEGVPSHWATYVTVEDADEVASHAQRLGGQVVAPPMDVPGVGRIAVLSDPTGAMIAVFRPGEFPGAAQLGPKPGTFGWSELHTRDTQAAAQFYTRLFGWTAKEDKGDPFPYTEFQVGGCSVGGMIQMHEKLQGVPPHWTPYVMVDDCAATAAKAQALGATLYVSPTAIPEVGTFAMFKDPSGAALAIIQMNVPA